MLLVKTINDDIQSTTLADAKTTFNSFKGWKCSAGFDFLWINSAGDVYGNVCRHSGKYGNVFTDIVLPTEPMLCPAEKCYCASDINISKAKNTLVDFKVINNAPLYDNADIIAIGSNERYFSINWNIGKRCNYDCSYCPSSVHDNNSPHMQFTDFKNAFDSIYKQVNLDSIKITFTGGEPTINPAYKNIVDYCLSYNNVSVFTNTNGTANKKQLLDYTNAGGIYLSIHSEYTQLDKLYAKIEYVASNKIDTAHLVVKVMLPLDFDETYINFVNNCKKLDKDCVFVNVEPLVDKSNSNKIYPYTDKQLKYIRTLEW